MAGARILLAEDEATQARTMIAALEGRGHQVRWVRAVRDVRAELPTFSPALLVLDVTLDTDGLELLQALRFAPQCPPGGVVVLTDPEDVRSRERAHQLGATAVVAKDPTPDRLVAVVEELIGFLG
jgi:DNA-binding response OmpR family regulator